MNYKWLYDARIYAANFHQHPSSSSSRHMVRWYVFCNLKTCSKCSQCITLMRLTLSPIAVNYVQWRFLSDIWRPSKVSLVVLDLGILNFVANLVDTSPHNMVMGNIKSQDGFKLVLTMKLHNGQWPIATGYKDHCSPKIRHQISSRLCHWVEDGRVRGRLRTWFTTNFVSFGM